MWVLQKKKLKKRTCNTQNEKSYVEYQRVVWVLGGCAENKKAVGFV
jgi:hypothetical protein